MKTKILLLTCLCVLAVGQAFGKSSDPFLILVTVPGKSHEIYSVSPDNKIKLVKILPGGPVESSLEGSTAPSLSPDGKKLAYLQGNNLWTKGLTKGTPKQITKEGFSHSKKYHSVFPLISGWSRDSKQLLYFLKHAEDGMEGEEDGPTLEPKDLKYGFYFYAPPEGIVELPGLEGYTFCGWSSKNEALLLSYNGVLLYAVETQGRPREIIIKFEGADTTSQLSAGPGNKALAVASLASQWSQVIEVDLSDGKALLFSPKKDWAAFNFPSYSPSGKRSAWIQTEREDDGTSGQYLAVDKAIVLELKTAPRYEWIDDGRIAVVQVDKAGKLELLVVDSSGGHTLARKGF